MNGRLYDSKVGRFLSPDPVLIANTSQNFNGYSYVNNNPLKYTDPTGEFAPLIAIAAVAAAAIVGGGLNLLSAALSGKVKSFGDGLAYFGAGAIGGGVAVFNPAAGFAVTAGLNIAADFATGNAYNTRGDASSGVNLFTLVSSVLEGFNAVGGGDIGNLVFKSLLARSTRPVLILATREIAITTTEQLAKPAVSQGVKLAAREATEIVGKEAAEQVAKETAEQLAKKGLDQSLKSSSNKLHSVYELVDASDNVVYVGRTSQELLKREAQHHASDVLKQGLKIRGVEGASNLTLSQARVLEQNLILKYGGVNGGQLLNKINSIAPKNWMKYGVKSIWP